MLHLNLFGDLSDFAIERDLGMLVLLIPDTQFPSMEPIDGTHPHRTLEGLTVYVASCGTKMSEKEGAR